ncbi:Ribosome-associated heat shock protein implicated in the recycling of the 50S subunit (S4 paralog) [hydrothermal vent metagenome]|uniref:Ribosome-associated heat shock protein implicated in the recycling of the 50S subunit (S4 paralog) n=1 Tax=hydrothermal vent metagenome TaxID=652676 RepID=A0A3B0U368_9ZZZZ
MLESVRVDKWLWSVRICKTRVISTGLCKRQKVSIDGQNVKPSREVSIGQVISVRRDGIHWTYKVLKCIDKRVGAKIALECYENLTSKEELNKLRLIKSGWVPRRDQGTGRPTKKERRDIDRLLKKED